MGYMGHLIEIFGAIQSTVSASEEFRALIESSLSAHVDGEGEPADDGPTVEAWNRILQSNEEEIKQQTRLLANCDPAEQQEYGGCNLAGFPSNAAEYENDTEDFDFQYNSAMQ
jgi:hypothetical protein